MEKFVQRENGVLGYSHSQGLSNGSPKTLTGSEEDMDFNDVFGGPPRRFSIQDVKVRYSFGEAVESDEEIVSSVNEKPVFGEDSVPRRRHHQGDDFFDDIFRGEDSHSSPRRADRDRDSVFGSSPGSRILSPAKPLPPKAEPFGTSVPAQFSLPAKLSKGLEIPAFGANGHYKMMDGAANGLNNPHLSRFPSQVNRSQDENPVYCHSPLSRGVSFSSDDLVSTATSGQNENVESLKKDKRNIDQFHFSIYKWAGREVPMLLPLVGRDNMKARDDSKYDRSASSNGQVESKLSTRVMKSRGLSAAGSEALNKEHKKEGLRREENMKEPHNSVTEKALHEAPDVRSRNITSSDGGGRQNIKEQVKSLDEVVVEEKTVKEVPLKKEESLQFELKPLHAFLGDENIDEQEKTEKEVRLKKEASLRFELKPLRTTLRDEIDLIEKTEEKVPLTKEESLRSEFKPLHAFLSDAVEQSGKNVEMKDNKTRIPNGIHRSFHDPKTVNKTEETRISSNIGMMDKSNLQAAAVNSGVTPAENGAKGKVREFVQIFNKEADSRPKANIQRRSQSSRWKTADTEQKENGMSTNADEVKEKVNLHNVAKKPHPVKVEENQNKDEAQQYPPAKTTSYTTHHSSTNQTNGFASEKFRRNSKIYVENFYDPLEDDFLVQELPDDHEKVTETEDFDDTKAIDAKIRQWSSGKKGNIRSLLSTLQFVLWPESGWKPIPLADLIETNSVKRAYQKALLRLHPDKLQQKGAAFHQKYIAEKVFDILQEAWDQFNTLVPL